jgi:hypothetical protein
MAVIKKSVFVEFYGSGNSRGFRDSDGFCASSSGFPSGKLDMVPGGICHKKSLG